MLKCDSGGFLAVLIPQRYFLIKLLHSMERTTWHPDEVARY